MGTRFYFFGLWIELYGFEGGMGWFCSFLVTEEDSDCCVLDRAGELGR